MTRQFILMLANLASWEELSSADTHFPVFGSFDISSYLFINITQYLLGIDTSCKKRMLR